MLFSKLVEIDAHELMKQAPWTIEYFMGQAKEAKTFSEKLEFAKLCMRDYENASHLRMVDKLAEAFTYLGDSFSDKSED